MSYRLVPVTTDGRPGRCHGAGTPEQPALARITVFAPPTEPVEDEDGCMESFQLFGVYELDMPFGLA